LPDDYAKAQNEIRDALKKRSSQSYEEYKKEKEEILKKVNLCNVMIETYPTHEKVYEIRIQRAYHNLKLPGIESPGYKSALEDATFCIEKNPKESTPYFLKAMALYKLWNYSEAKDFILKAYNIYPRAEYKIHMEEISFVTSLNENAMKNFSSPQDSANMEKVLEFNYLYQDFFARKMEFTEENLFEYINRSNKACPQVYDSMIFGKLCKMLTDHKNSKIVAKFRTEVEKFKFKNKKESEKSILELMERLLQTTQDTNSVTGKIKTKNYCQKCGNPAALKCSQCANRIATYYCSAKCQAADWKDHKRACNGKISGTDWKLHMNE